MDWPSAATMSAPISPGDLIRPHETASVVTTTISAPASRAALPMAVTSVTAPKRLGVCTTTQAVEASTAPITPASPSTASGMATTSRPAASAMVRIVAA